MKESKKEFSSVRKNQSTFNNYGANLSDMHPTIVNWIGENTNQRIIIVTDEGIIKYVTNSFYELLNFDLIGKNIKSFLYKQDLISITKKLEKSISKQINYSLNLIKKNNKTLLLDMIIKHVETDCKSYYICYVDDQTREQQIEEMIIRAEKMSIAGQVSAGLAHEIRNPLTSLKGFIQLLQAGVEQKETYYKILLKEIKKIESITTELLYIAKPLTYHKEEKSINKLIREVLVLLEPQAKIRDVLLYWEEKEDHKIFCNGTHMKQILINLIKNAIEASEKSNQVIIDVFNKLNNVIIEIIDEGVGIPREYIHKLNEPFFTTKEDGTGLGLMITKNLIDYHEAKLEVVSEENKGTTFRIIMPGKID